MKIIRLSALCLFFSASLTFAQQENIEELDVDESGVEFSPDAIPATPEDLIDDEHVREELAVNDFTAPSIAKVFESLQALAPLPADQIERKIPERMPLDRADLAIEIGFLIADGFLIVQAGELNKVENLAKELSRYGKALGAGDRVSRHVAALLENARKNDSAQLKLELAATQKDVERELVALRDTDLAHLISLGGWLRALNVAAGAVDAQYSRARAKEIMREDIADYYTEILGTLHPRISDRPNFTEMREILSGLRNDMIVDKAHPITAARVKQIHTKSTTLLGLAAKRVDQ
jgi:hypothetical protein